MDCLPPVEAPGLGGEYERGRVGPVADGDGDRPETGGRVGVAAGHGEGATLVRRGPRAGAARRDRRMARGGVKGAAVTPVDLHRVLGRASVRGRGQLVLVVERADLAGQGEA